MEAELARVEGRPGGRGLCQDAARAADAQNDAPLAALAIEIAARHHAAPESVGPLRDDAIRRYDSWGASLLANRLRRISSIPERDV